MSTSIRRLNGLGVGRRGVRVGGTHPELLGFPSLGGRSGVGFFAASLSAAVLPGFLVPAGTRVQPVAAARVGASELAVDRLVGGAPGRITEAPRYIPATERIHRCASKVEITPSSVVAGRYPRIDLEAGSAISGPHDSPSRLRHVPLSRRR